MNRLEQIREKMDAIVEAMPDASARRCAYAHLYGVSMACVLLAQHRGVDSELAAVAGMLHDMATYKTGDSAAHAHRGARLAQELLGETKLFSEEEIRMVCGAIDSHSDKQNKHTPFAEVLIDADVLQHCLYDPSAPVAEHEQARFARLQKELELK